jgi:hypothetical protein
MGYTIDEMIKALQSYKEQFNGDMLYVIFSLMNKTE